MRTNRFYRGFVVLGVAVLMASVVVTAAPYAQQTATEAKPKPTPKPTPQALWVVNGVSPYAGPYLSAFGGSRLTQKTKAVGANGIVFPTADAQTEALTYDSQNNLWISFCAASDSLPSYLIELTVGELKNLVTDNGGPTGPKIFIEDPSLGTPDYLACPRALVFDPLGNLWVETAGGTDTDEAPALLEYAKINLTASTLVATPPASTVIVTSGVQTNFGPALAFDKNGNLWQSGGVINSGNPADEQQTVVEYTADQLAAGTQTDPNQTLIVADTSNEGALNAPSSITFDANGNLWVAFALGGTDNVGGVEEIAASDLTGTGTSTPSPAVTLSSAAFVTSKTFGSLASFANPDGLAFDGTGDLWVANQSKQAEQGKKLGDGSIVEFTASQLTTGSPVPVRGILANKKDTNLGAPIYMTFGPPLP
jgi:hypothetical protein